MECENDLSTKEKTVLEMKVRTTECEKAREAARNGGEWRPSTIARIPGTASAKGGSQEPRGGSAYFPLFLRRAFLAAFSFRFSFLRFSRSSGPCAGLAADPAVAPMHRGQTWCAGNCSLDE